MPRTPSDIPVGSQFSPKLIDLEEFLKAIITNSGDKNAMQAAIWKPPVHRTREKPDSRRNASLPLEAAVQYGLLEKGTYVVTDLAKSLANLSRPALYETFARHILLNLGGLRVVEGAEQMEMDRTAGLSDIVVTGDSLARHLSAQGFRVVEHNTAINSLRMWLAEAGLFNNRGDMWKVNRTAKEKLVGLSDQAISILAGLSDAQLAFVEALCRINPTGWHPAADIRDLAEGTFHIHLGRGSLPKEVLEPLKRAGLIEFDPGGTQSGKTSTLKTTDKFNIDVLEPFVTKTVNTLDPVVTEYYKKRPQDIYTDLDSADTFTKGQALEAYAIHIMRLLGLRFLAWRKRAPDTTGRSEIDVLLSGLFGSLPTLWQVQCKNTPRGNVDLEDVAKEVGQTLVTKATHLLMIANAPFTQDARDFALQVMRSDPLTIFLLDKDDFAEVKASPGKLGDILHEIAEGIIQSRSQASAFAPSVRSRRIGL